MELMPERTNFDKMPLVDQQRFLFDLNTQGTSVMSYKLFMNRGDRKDLMRTTERLGDYVHACVMLAECIQDDEPIKASIHRERKSNIYDSLPAYAKWRN